MRREEKLLDNNKIKNTINTSTITQSVLVGGAIITLSPPTKTQKKEYIQGYL